MSTARIVEQSLFPDLQPDKPVGPILPSVFAGTNAELMRAVAPYYLQDLDLWRAAEAVVAPDAGYFDFVNPTGRSGSIMLPIWLAAFGDECVEAISRLGVVRRAA